MIYWENSLQGDRTIISVRCSFVAKDNHSQISRVSSSRRRDERRRRIFKTIPGFARQQSRRRTSTSRLYDVDGFPGVDRAQPRAQLCLVLLGWKVRRRRLPVMVEMDEGEKLHRSRHSLWRHCGALLSYCHSALPIVLFFFAQLVKAYGLSPAMPYIGFSSLRGDNSCRPTHGNARPDASDSGLQSLAMPDTSRPHAAHSTAYHFRAHSINCLLWIPIIWYTGHSTEGHGTVENCGTLRNTYISLWISPFNLRIVFYSCISLHQNSFFRFRQILNV